MDLYHSNGIRARTYDYPQYKAEFLYYSQEIVRAFPNAPKRLFQGLVNIGYDWLGSHLDDYLQATAPTLFSISQHSYPVPSCDGEVVRLEEVLDDQYATSTAAFVRQHNTVQTLKALGIEFVIGEGSAAVCSGGPGPIVLNVFATALWVVHELFEVASVGVAHFHFHSWGTETATFSVLVYGNPAAPNRFLVQPLYYGMRLFAMATSHNATMVRTALTSANSHVHAYAAINSLHVLSVVLLHKDLNATGNATVSITVPVTLSPSAAPPTATVIRMLAPSALSEYGVTLAGQTYDNSQDGKPLGAYLDERVEGTTVQGGVLYTVQLSPLSAVLLRLTMPTKADAERVHTEAVYME